MLPESVFHPSRGSISMSRSLSIRLSGFTLVELIVVIAIIGVRVARLLRAVQWAGGAARRMQCSTPVRQLPRACHNYHDVYNRLPTGSQGRNPLDPVWAYPS